jgi:hypothetical protein
MTGILNAIFATFGGPGETTVEYLVVAGGGGGGYKSVVAVQVGQWLSYKLHIFCSTSPTSGGGLLNLLLPHLGLHTQSPLVLEELSGSSRLHGQEE